MLHHLAPHQVGGNELIASRSRADSCGPQIEGIEFIVRKSGRALLADEMGLGKSVQALGAALCLHGWPLLFCCFSVSHAGFVFGLGLLSAADASDGLPWRKNLAGKFGAPLLIVCLWSAFACRHRLATAYRLPCKLPPGECCLYRRMPFHGRNCLYHREPALIILTASIVVCLP